MGRGGLTCRAPEFKKNKTLGGGDLKRKKTMAQYPGQNYEWGQPTQQQNPIWGNLLSMIPTVGPILGGISNQITQRIGINKQNQYNDPASQVSRLRKAGLPMASMTPAGAGNQSAVPAAHLGGGIAEGSKNIGLYAQTQQTKEAIKLLNEQIRIQKAEADLKNAERDYKLGGAGTDVAGTNLTEGMIAEQNLKIADAAAKQLLNDYQKRVNENQPTRTEIENQQIIATTAKAIKDANLVDEKITTEKLEQDLKQIEKEWRPSMNDAQKKEILARTGLIREQTTGAQLENIIKEVDGRLKQETAGNVLTQSDIDTSMKKVMSQAQWNEFIKTTEYNEMVKTARRLFVDHNWGGNPKLMADELSALIYTTISNITGGAPGSTGLLGLFK